MTSLRSAAARRLHAQTNWAFSLPNNFLIVSGSTRRLLRRLETGKDLVSCSLVFICLQEQQHNTNSKWKRTNCFLYLQPKTQVLISRESDQMKPPSPSHFFLFVIQAWNSFTTMWAHVFTVKRSHTDTHRWEMMLAALCKIMMNEKQNKTGTELD